MTNFDDVAKVNIKENNTNWPQIYDHCYRILITGGSGCGKTNSLFHVISHRLNVDKIYLYVKNSCKANCQLLITKRESTVLKHVNDSKTFFVYLNHMNDKYKNIEEYNPKNKRKMLLAFNDLIADMLSNKKHSSIVTELFISGRKLIISLAFITQSYFAVPKNFRQNSAHCFIIKIPNKRGLYK